VNIEAKGSCQVPPCALFPGVWKVSEHLEGHPAVQARQAGEAFSLQRPISGIHLSALANIFVRTSLKTSQALPFVVPKAAPLGIDIALETAGRGPLYKLPGVSPQGEAVFGSEAL
jgi:hypothetical protein